MLSYLKKVLSTRNLIQHMEVFSHNGKSNMVVRGGIDERCTNHEVKVNEELSLTVEELKNDIVLNGLKELGKLQTMFDDVCFDKHMYIEENEMLKENNKTLEGRLVILEEQARLPKIESKMIAYDDMFEVDYQVEDETMNIFRF
ncbi:hypothetical protein Fmac_027170 [Flemingia macrophylla]|uniref:Uncharacterized protein n=1 Tax=Flemingia macrophylla TaxID=520843 RepID=A0ABD1LH81_9FABA